MLGVESIDPEARTVTFPNRINQPRELTGKSFRVADGARISIDGEPGTLAQVPPGAILNFYFCVDQQTIDSFDAGGPQYSDVVVKSVDAEKQLLTVDPEKAPPEVAGITFPLTKNARITVDLRPGELSEIRGGAVVSFDLTADRKRLSAVSAAAPLYDAVLKSVDAMGRMITIAASKSQGERVFAVSPDAEVNIDFKRGGLAKLPSGASTNLVLSVDGMTICRIDATGAGIFGTVQKVVPGRRQVVVDGRTFPVDNDAEISIDFKPGGKLESLLPGAVVSPLVLSVDQQTVIRIEASGDRLNGVLQAVDSEKHRITVAGKTYSVCPDATIQLDGSRATLADLPVGAVVDPLILSVDQTSACLITATSP